MATSTTDSSTLSNSTLSTDTTTVTETSTQSTPRTSSTTVSTATSATTSEKPPSPVTPMGAGPITGIVVGAAVFLALIIVVVVVCLLRRRRRKNQKSPPATLPDPYPAVNDGTNCGPTCSTTDLMRNDSLDPNSGTSADELPIAPLPPSLDYEPPDLRGGQEVYENQGRDELPEDYEKPVKWGGPVTSDDLYMPMANPRMQVKSGDLDKPVPSSQLVSEYVDPHKPPQCVGTPNKGYINVPGSQSAVGTLPKYANMQKADGKDLEDDEDDREDYENVPKSVLETKSGSHGNKSKTSRQMMMELSAEAVHKKDQIRASPNQKEKVKLKSATAPKNTAENSSSSPSSVPKGKHKTWTKPSSNGEGAPDYVNVKEYSKVIPKAKGDRDLVSFNKKAE